MGRRTPSSNLPSIRETTTTDEEEGGNKDFDTATVLYLYRRDSTLASDEELSGRLRMLFFSNEGTIHPTVSHVQIRSSNSTPENRKRFARTSDRSMIPMASCRAWDVSHLFEDASKARRPWSFSAPLASIVEYIVGRRAEEEWVTVAVLWKSLEVASPSPSPSPSPSVATVLEGVE